MVKKPIELKSDPDIEYGLVKGIGIGLIGLTLRPVIGLFDFASQGFEDIRGYFISGNKILHIINYLILKLGQCYKKNILSEYDRLDVFIKMA